MYGNSLRVVGVNEDVCCGGECARPTRDEVGVDGLANEPKPFF